MAIRDDAPEQAISLEFFIDEGNSNTRFIRAYTKDLVEPIQTVTDYNYDGSTYVVVGPISRDTTNSAHGTLSGLLNDDHPQYLNEVRHDALPSDNPHNVTAAQTGAYPTGDVDNLLFSDTAVDIVGRVNQTTTLFTQLTLNTNVPLTGLYKITWTYVWSTNDTGEDFVGALRVNSTTIWNHRQEPKDAGGPGVTLPNTTGGNTNTGTDQRHVVTTHEVINLTSGSNTIDLQFAGSDTNIEAAMYRSRISIEKFGVS